MPDSEPLLDNYGADLLDIGERRMSIGRAISPPDLTLPDDEGDDYDNDNDGDEEIDDVAYFHTDSKSPIPVTSPAKGSAPGAMIPIKVTSLRDPQQRPSEPPQQRQPAQLAPQPSPAVRKSAPGSLAHESVKSPAKNTGGGGGGGGGAPAARSYGEGLRMWWTGKVCRFIRHSTARNTALV